MPTEDDLLEFGAQYLRQLHKLTNGILRATQEQIRTGLDWDSDTYDEVEAFLIEKGLVVRVGFPAGLVKLTHAGRMLAESL